MKLYGVMLSPYVTRAALTCWYKNLDFEQISISASQAKEPEFLEISPMGKIPILVDGDVVLSESTAICEYIDAKYGDKKLIPENPVKAAHVRMLCQMAGLYIQEGSVSLGQHMGPNRDQDFVDNKLAEIERGLKAVEHHMANGPELGPVGSSMVDCYMIPALFFFHFIMKAFIDGAPLANYPLLAAYWQRLSADDIAIETLEILKDELAVFMESLKAAAAAAAESD